MSPTHDALKAFEGVLTNSGGTPYLVVSSAGQPRRALPLGRAFRSSIQTYTPTTPLGVARRYGAMLSARLGLQRFLPGRRVLASSPLTHAIASALGEDEVILSVARSYGGRLVITASSTDGEIIAFVKLAASDNDIRALAAEADTIRNLAGMDLEFRVPSVIALTELEQFTGLVLSPVGVVGGMRPWRLTPRRIAASESMFGEGVRSRRLSESLDITTETAWRSQLDSVHDWLGRRHIDLLPIGMIHGDFAPWNVLERNGVVGLIDWEHSGDGFPFWDLWHFAVQGAALSNRPWSLNVMRSGVRGEGPLARALAAYCHRVGTPLKVAEAVFAVYLARSGAQLAAYPFPRPDHLRGLAVRERLLNELLETKRDGAGAV
jgi:phosphotransferase family enzyme